ncbi:V-set and immunoglobulin domain-containing protein 8 [Bombina bombina]|uniref:V-set and immunoglobulin domain-containing protein 8 n=1 Tax=Bombina bombina TaxID=8345 RepID=UPI00235B3067|nr:V-set and immunoglobulin domain-containing protein 8 [Bombina bombina]
MGEQSLAVLLVLCLMPALMTSLTITELNTQIVYKPSGESVKHSCMYTLAPADTGSLDIEWVLMNPDSTGLDKVILTYMDNVVVPKGPPELMSRLSFSAGDPSNGDASITITYLEITDSGTYQCKVKKNPGIASIKTTLIIHDIPSKPRCWVEGEQTQGKDVILKCKSDKGTTPFSYEWAKIAGPQNPATPVINMGSVTGDLVIKNISQVYTGTYQCTVKNTVGQGQCVAELSASSANRAGIIAGAVIGALLLLLLILLLIWCLICCCNRRRYEKELANDIKEDVPAPESNPNSRYSSIRTALGYRSHNISTSLRRAYNITANEEFKAPSQTSSELIKPKVEIESLTPQPIITLQPDISPQPSFTMTSRHTPYNIQRVGGVPVMVPAQSREGFIV